MAPCPSPHTSRPRSTADQVTISSDDVHLTPPRKAIPVQLQYLYSDVLVGRYEQIDLMRKLQILSYANATEKDIKELKRLLRFKVLI